LWILYILQVILFKLPINAIYTPSGYKFIYLFFKMLKITSILYFYMVIVCLYLYYMFIDYTQYFDGYKYNCVFLHYIYGIWYIYKIWYIAILYIVIAKNINFLWCTYINLKWHSYIIPVQNIILCNIWIIALLIGVICCIGVL
jgi:hypothetical protein